MGAEIEVKLSWVSDADVHCCPSRDVPTTTNLHKEKKNIQFHYQLVINQITNEQRNLSIHQCITTMEAAAMEETQTTSTCTHDCTNKEQHVCSEVH